MVRGSIGARALFSISFLALVFALSACTPQYKLNSTAATLNKLADSANGNAGGNAFAIGETNVTIGSLDDNFNFAAVNFDVDLFTGGDYKDPTGKTIERIQDYFYLHADTISNGVILTGTSKDTSNCPISISVKLIADEAKEKVSLQNASVTSSCETASVVQMKNFFEQTFSQVKANVPIELSLTSSGDIQITTGPIVLNDYFDGGSDYDGKKLTFSTHLKIIDSSFSKILAYFGGKGSAGGIQSHSSCSPLPVMPDGAPVATLLLKDVQPTSIAVQGDYVYWSNSLSWQDMSSSVNKFSSKTGANTVLVSDIMYTSSLVADAENIYWIDNASTHRYSIDGRSKQDLFYGYNTPLVLNDGILYYGFSPNGVRSINRSSEETVISPLAEDENVGAAPFSVAVDSTNVYWMDWNGVLKTVAKSGGSKTTIASSKNSHATALQQSGNDLYYSNSDGVYKVSKSGGEIKQIASICNANYLKIYGQKIYVATDTGIAEIDMDSFAVKTLVDKQKISSSSNGSVYSNVIDVDASSVYFGTETGLYQVAH